MAIDRAQLEAIAFRSWPAAHVEQRRGVLLRATGGESMRANSAALHACDPGLSAADAIAIAEDFYRARRAPVRLQVGPLSPVGIDQALAERGYSVAAPVRVQTASVAELLARAAAATPKPEVEAVIDTGIDDDWITIEVARGRYAGIAETFLGCMRSLGERAGFGVARVDGRRACACLFYAEGEVAFVAAMRTLPEERRRGAARALLDAGARWANGRGATQMALQVDRDNAAAIALYAAAGFADAYAYHYRVL